MTAEELSTKLLADVKLVAARLALLGPDAICDSPADLEWLADKAFDLALAQAADNVYAARLAAPLQSHSRRFWFAAARPDSLAEAAAHHLDLINAILERDADLAHDEALRLMALLEAMARGR